MKCGAKLSTTQLSLFLSVIFYIEIIEYVYPVNVREDIYFA